MLKYIYSCDRLRIRLHQETRVIDIDTLLRWYEHLPNLLAIRHSLKNINSRLIKLIYLQIKENLKYKKFLQVIQISVPSWNIVIRILDGLDLFISNMSHSFKSSRSANLSTPPSKRFRMIYYSIYFNRIKCKILCLTYSVSLFYYLPLKSSSNELSKEAVKQHSFIELQICKYNYSIFRIDEWF